MNRHVYLIGMPGSGKTSVGRALAEMLDAPFVDLDEEIERDVGAPVANVFHDQGEDAFRDMESDALARVAGEAPSVVACGGGTPLRERNQTLMRSTGHLVYLRMPADALRRRIEIPSKDRPLLQDDGDLDRLLEQREGTYVDVSTTVISGDAPPEVVARAIAEEVG